MNKKVIENAQIGEKYIDATLPCGLKIYICPKPESSSYYAVFGTRYGSIDNRFKINDGEMIEVPEGIAHFLEHKLFESEDGDAFSKYAKTGASANAYTSFDRTCYLFSCSERFDENMDILLNFVQSPYFTKETVDKEQGIIGQEIRMYEDNPGWRVFFNMLGGMFENHPVKIDIPGTVESIAEIDDKLLYSCYNAFYNPANMFICVSGNVDADKLIDKISTAIKVNEPVHVERGTFSEPERVTKSFVSQKLAVSMPLFTLGFKEKCEKPNRTLKELVSTSVLLSMLFGATSPLYERLIEKELINSNFDYEYFTGHGYAVPMISGESNQAEQVRDEIFAQIRKCKAEGLDKDQFESIRKSKLGQNIMSFNTVEGAVSAMIDSHMENVGLFDDIEVLKNLTCEDLQERLNTLNENCAVLSVVTG